MNQDDDSWPPVVFTQPKLMRFGRLQFGLMQVSLLPSALGYHGPYASVFAVLIIGVVFYTGLRKGKPAPEFVFDQFGLTERLGPNSRSCRWSDIVGLRRVGPRLGAQEAFGLAVDCSHHPGFFVPTLDRVIRESLIRSIVVMASGAAAVTLPVAGPMRFRAGEVWRAGAIQMLLFLTSLILIAALLWQVRAGFGW